MASTKRRDDPAIYGPSRGRAIDSGPRPNAFAGLVGAEVAEMVYYGFWYHAKFDALLAFIHQAQKPVTGEATLDLYKGNIDIASRTSPRSLYDEGIASMEGGGSYNQTDAEGFLRIQGLPVRVQGRVNPRA